MQGSNVASFMHHKLCYHASHNKKKVKKYLVSIHGVLFLGNITKKLNCGICRFNWSPAQMSGREVGYVLRFTSGLCLTATPNPQSQHLYSFVNTVLCAWKTFSSIFNCYSPPKVKQLICHLFCEAFSGQNGSLTLLTSESFAYTTIIEFVSIIVTYQPSNQTLSSITGLNCNHLCISRNKLWNGVEFTCSKNWRGDTNLSFLFFQSTV